MKRPGEGGAMHSRINTIVLIIIPLLLVAYLDVAVARLGDIDDDGVLDLSDNCPTIPNGPLLGTCIDSVKVPIPCHSDRDCLLPIIGSCQMYQEDYDRDLIGNVCDPCPSLHTDLDDDDDCVANKDDGCPNDPDKSEPGYCGCGFSETDTDNDGMPDCVDECDSDPDKTEAGICGCGISDADPDGDGFPICMDECPLDSSKQEPGVCGCGVVDLADDQCTSQAKLPDTGQYECFDDLVSLVPCPGPGQSYFGQDANYQINPPDFSKLNAFGKVIDDTSHSWSMVRDNNTNLIWHAKEASDGIANDRNIHDPDNTYHYCRSPGKGEIFPDICDKDFTAATDTQEYITMLNMENGGQGYGYHQWRMPTVKELTTLFQAVNPGRFGPYHLFPEYLSGEASGTFWTATESTNLFLPGVFTINFTNLVGSGDITTERFMARHAIAVSGKKAWSYDRYVSNFNGTVTDTSTGLMWLVEPADDNFDGLADAKTFEESLLWAEGLDEGGFDDWRLANRNELLSLIDYGSSTPAYDTTFFPGVYDDSSNHARAFWSSTTAIIDEDSVQGVFVEFANGRSSSTIKGQHYYARAVRGGQQRVKHQGQLAIASPVQGEIVSFGGKWESGEEIIWNPGTVPLSEQVKIYFSRDAGLSWQLISEWQTVVAGHLITMESVDNSGLHLWNPTGPDSVNCMIKIVPVNPVYAEYETTSGLFSIREVEDTHRISYWYYDADPDYYYVQFRATNSQGIVPEWAIWTVTDGGAAGQINFQTGQLTNVNSLNGWVRVATDFYMAENPGRYLFFAPNRFAAEYEEDGTIPGQNNNLPENAAVVYDGWFYTGELSSGDDVDYYTFSLTADTIVNVGFLYQQSCTLPPCSEIPETTIEVRSVSTGNTLASVSATTYSLETIGLPAGHYYIKLSSEDVFTSYGGNYMLSFKKDEDAVYSPNPMEPTELVVNMNPPEKGVVNSLTDEASYRFSVTQASSLELHFAPSSETATYHLEIRDYQGTVVTKMESVSLLPVTLGGLFTPAGGPYTIVVRSSGMVDALNPFNIRIMDSENSYETEPNNRMSSADSLKLDVPINGRMDDVADEDYFTFTLTAPSYLNFFLFTPGSDKDYTVTIFKWESQQSVDEISTTNGHNVSLHTGLREGTYFVRVKSLGAAEMVHYYRLLMQGSMRTSLELEYNDSILSSDNIEPSIYRTGRIFSTTDIDYFGFGVSPVGTETTDVEILFDSYSTDGDYRVSLLDVNRNEVASAESNNGDDLILNATLSSGNHYIKIAFDSYDDGLGKPGTIDPLTHYQLTLNGVAADLQNLKQISSITISGAVDEMNPGESQNLEAWATYDDSSQTGHASQAFTWESTNPEVATVVISHGGIVELLAHEEGATTIRASLPGDAPGVYGNFPLVVGNRPVGFQSHGNLILVAGGGDDTTDPFYDSTKHLSERVYRTFVERAFDDEDIYFASPALDRDLTGDGVYDEGLIVPGFPRPSS